MSNAPHLQFVDFSGNALTSTIPVDFFPIETNPFLEYIYLFSNQLEGTLSNNVGNMVHLIDLLVHDNQFTGTLPSTLYQCTNLVSLFVQNNHFEGSPDLAFRNDAASFYQLQAIDFASNAFTGTIPSVLFYSPSLVYYSCSQNCFHGELPEGICSAITLQQLYMEGVRSGEKCKTRIFGSLSEVYFSQAVPGTIPHCLWDMPVLQFLYLSGNLLEGTFPDDKERNVSSIRHIGKGTNDVCAAVAAVAAVATATAAADNVMIM